MDPPPRARTRSSTAHASRPSGRRTARSGTSPRSRRRPRPGTSACSTRRSPIPGRTDHDEVVVTLEEIAASGLDYLALGHWHSPQVAKTKGVTYAYAGAPEPVAVDQDKAGKVLLVTLDDADGRHAVTVEERAVGRTVFERRDIDAATLESQPALVAALRKGANPDLVLDVRLIGVRPDALDLDPRGGRAGAPGRVPPGPPPRPQPPGAHRGRAAARARRSPARSSATSRVASRTSRRRATTWPVARPRSCATSSASGRLLLAGQEVTL